MHKTFAADTQQLDIITAQRYYNNGSRSNARQRKKAVEIISLFMQNELTEKQKLYITDYLINGKKQKEIADKYGVAACTVSRTIKTGLTRIRKLGRYIDIR